MSRPAALEPPGWQLVAGSAAHARGPHHGTDAGCQAQLEAVRVPWLCVHARDDPVIHVEPVLAAARALRATEGTQAVFVVTPRGGHLGFAGGSATSWQDEPSWADELAAAFLAHHAGAKPAPVLSRL